MWAYNKHYQLHIHLLTLGWDYVLSHMVKNVDPKDCCFMCQSQRPSQQEQKIITTFFYCGSIWTGKHIFKFDDMVFDPMQYA